jgi:hypothetical protein
MKSKIMGRFLPHLNPEVFFEVWVENLHGGYRLLRCVRSFKEAATLKEQVATWAKPLNGNKE